MPGRGSGLARPGMGTTHPSAEQCLRGRGLPCAHRALSCAALSRPTLEPDPTVEHLRTLIREIPDFPSPGILFRDIMPLLRAPHALREIVGAFAARHGADRIDIVAGVESRGFLLGAPLAQTLGVGFVAIRKLGKLPGPTVQREYALEYGSNHLEVQADSLKPGERVLVVDDVLATGGTARAALELVRELGAEPVAAAFLLELSELGGRSALGHPVVTSLLRY
jgi:adenine phosphoribosyltransferase